MGARVPPPSMLVETPLAVSCVVHKNIAAKATCVIVVVSFEVTYGTGAIRHSLSLALVFFLYPIIVVFPREGRFYPTTTLFFVYNKTQFPCRALHVFVLMVPARVCFFPYGTPIHEVISSTFAPPLGPFGILRHAVDT